VKSLIENHERIPSDCYVNHAKPVRRRANSYYWLNNVSWNIVTEISGGKFELGDWR